MKPHLQTTIRTLLEAGATQREIERVTGISRHTIRAWQHRFTEESEANCSGVATGSQEQTAPPRPPAPTATTTSLCEPHRTFIEAQLRLKRNATAIYQDLVDQFGFAGHYNSVKRFVARLKAREPERFDVLEALPGEEAQVDFGQGASTRMANGKYRKPYLFVMTLKYSGKSFRKVVWKADQETWARLHEEAFRAFGGAVAYVVLDNLKQGVLEPNLYDPLYNPLYVAMLAHYGAVADAARVVDPNRKGTVENAIQHTQSTALKGRKFESIDEQNVWLAHWEERWAAPRIHGRKKRQVLAMFAEEKPALKPLPATRFRYFRETSHTVDDSALVQVLSVYYAALPASPGDIVTVRLYDHDLEIIDAAGQLLLRLGHQAAHAGQLADLLTASARAGALHEEDGVEARFAGLEDLALVGLHRVEHDVRDALGDVRPDVDDLVVALALGDDAVLGLLLDHLDLAAGLGDLFRLADDPDQVVHRLLQFGLQRVRVLRGGAVCRCLEGDQRPLRRGLDGLVGHRGAAGQRAGVVGGAQPGPAAEDQQVRQRVA
ncbi:MAG: hypothetical protein B7Z83_07650, partial [Thiomonas sp. 20-64-5]